MKRSQTKFALPAIPSCDFCTLRTIQPASALCLSNMAVATTVANKPIRFVFAVRSLLFLLLNGAPAYSLSDSDISIVVDIINVFRAAVSPTAADMRYMAWSEDLAKEATELANKCKWVLHKPGVSIFPWPWANGYVDIFQYNLKEGRNDFDYGRCHLEKKRCRFYRDVMEAGADRIGCGDAECPYYGWLHYCVTNARSSNEPFTDLVYTRGTPCQRCPKSAGYCYRNLCVSHATKTFLERTQSAVITCDAPCVNCGERKDANNACFCQCPTGYNSEVDCSEGSGKLTCSACRRAGTPCQNGGRDVGGPSDPCRCLCGDYGGEFCEIPIAQVVGGIVVRLRHTTTQEYFPRLILRTADIATAVLKNEMADGINSFCRKNQTSYLECCGYGTLPINGPMDFVDASSVHVACPITEEFLDWNTTCTIYATAKGNNGLCRKQTSIPAPTLAVPPSVVSKAFYGLPLDAIYQRYGFITREVIDTVSMKVQMNYISVRVG